MAPPSLANNQLLDTADITQRYNLMIDIATAALMCDRTRIVTLDIHKALGPGPDPNNTALVGHFHNPDSNGGSWHGLAHDWGNANSRRMLAGINTWVANNVFLKILQKLDVPEAGGSTYLDDSLVYSGQRARFQPHQLQRTVLARRQCGGYIKPGRYIDYIGLGSAELLRTRRRQRHSRASAQSVFRYPFCRRSGYRRPTTSAVANRATARPRRSASPPTEWPVDYDLCQDR